MTTTIIQYNSLDDLIEHAHSGRGNIPNKLPAEVIDELSLRPVWVLEVFEYLKNNQHQEKRRLEIVFEVLAECLDQVRYRIDRNDSEGQKLLDDIKQAGDRIIGELPVEFRMKINQIIFDAKVPLRFSVSFESIEGEPTVLPDIQPKLPELLETLRRKSGFKTAFELNELLLPHLQQLPSDVQLSIVSELAQSKKSLAHETAVLMLLHPEQEVRSQVANLLYALSDKKLFTPIDLRRLIVLRNWVPEEEREPIDLLIQKLKRNKLQPAPYLQTKPSRIAASIVDGAGAGLIMFEAKRLKQRFVGGVLFKIGVGIKDAWTMKKASKHTFDDIAERSSENGTAFRSVSKNYANSLIQHFLYVAISSKQPPSATLIELAEAVGGDKWRPNSLDWSSSVQTLVESVSDTSDQLIEKALNSTLWARGITLCEHWFETGPLVEEAVIEATNRHQQNPSKSLKKVTTQCLMEHCIDKWKLILLIAAMWTKASSDKETFVELVSVLEALNKGFPPENISIIQDIVGRSTASMIQRYRATSS